MSHDDATLAYIIEAQMQIFEDARHDLQLSLPKIAQLAHLPVTTVNAWAQGRNALSLWGLKKLMRVDAMVPLLSRLFEPEGFVVVKEIDCANIDAVADACHDLLARKERAHREDSPAGRDIHPDEHDELNSSITRLRSRVGN